MHTCKLGVYAVYDRVSGFLSCFTCAASAGLACREVLKVLPAVRFDDYQLYLIGDYVLNAPPVKGDTQAYLTLGKEVKVNFYPVSKWKPVKWSSWRAPENEAELLAPLGLSKTEVENIVASKQHQLNLATSPRGEE